MPDVQLLEGDVLERLRELPDGCIHTVVTSPPYYWLRDYGIDGQIGLEPSPAEYLAKMVEVFGEIRRVLRDDGTAWVNMGDSYNSYNGNRGTDSAYAGDRKRFEAMTPGGNGLAVKDLKQKDLMGMPWRLAFALQDDGWYLRQDIIWHKPNPMPESVRDRCTKAHEYIFLLSKSPRYYFDAEAIKEPVSGNAHSRGRGVTPKSEAAMDRPDGWKDGPGAHGTIEHSRRPRPRNNSSFALATKSSGNKARKPRPGGPELFAGEQAGSVPWEGTHRNKRSVWTVPSRPFKEAHFATFPVDLILPCILAGAPEGGTVLDPFGGAGTTGVAALKVGRSAILIELNPEYAGIARQRLEDEQRQHRLI